MSNFASHDMKGIVWTYAVRIVLLLCAVMLAGVFFGLQSRTMVNPWIVITIACVIAMPLSFLIASKDSRIVPFPQLPLRAITWLIPLVLIFTGIIYGANYIGADRESGVKMTAHVERKYYKNRQHTRRVGRGRYAPTGRTYRVYYADIRLEDGHEVSVPLKGTQITRVREGRAVEVKVADGGLGMSVILTDNIFDNLNKKQ